MGPPSSGGFGVPNMGPPGSGGFAPNLGMGPPSSGGFGVPSMGPPSSGGFQPVQQQGSPYNNMGNFSPPHQQQQGFQQQGFQQNYQQPAYPPNSGFPPADSSFAPQGQGYPSAPNAGFDQDPFGDGERGMMKDFSKGKMKKGIKHGGKGMKKAGKEFKKGNLKKAGKKAGKNFGY
eukprot:CAMPEP_0174276218 /NCGR_PEP_ID=MMETSP0439-20130205/60263_1 /TAXON_ID=0 /ORGANISM="Stereomyxa ramosa, Strain Chinc5" /LENGTH=174 /DNA_ID=CAMNT_0015368417 /DNA_START=94 /DNA_END=618 /DNA_ORIENTATION=-